MKKKQNTVFGVIGLGRFGEALAMMLAESENEVIVVDRDENKIKEMRQYTEYAFVADNLSTETLREIGITLFLSIVGINAGASGFWQTLTQGPGFSWMCWGTLVTFIPLIVVGILAYKISKVNYLVLSGMLAGSYTDPPALAFANGLHSNPEASSLGYAPVYPVTMFLRILSPQIMIIIAILASGMNV